ncbi:NADP-dependent oxidoreductase [Paenarthrobacter ilicis]|uniref:NADPH:quinone reductase-like Zn-dependent oxidoreductase n=1 Tax=Paenarthrobacter ilicis TaxID=43665 RepID=A0ABX0THY6_9MICC|nr:NADP-dependent oxidoreductase [Paenarthrobacter ilicis]MBM7791924.1 NADPH:quinone reductase-like Zn-dependent oxidoreductase [Paenarthrobacter ilicis]NIJ01451.1 NADPH:quinone reductase-like Zn-dependent oxidoreductase [Paenarthrobacter ilicis]
MKAITYSEYGNPHVLELTDQPMPKVGPGMVLVKIKATSVNPVDWKIMGGYLDPLMDIQFPAIPGWDVAGVVESVGIDSHQFKPGDEVISYARKDYVHGGSFAEYIALPERVLARKPTTLDWNESAGLPLTGLTAFQVLSRLDVKSGETLLIHGGSGGVGSLAIQIASARGVKVIATASEKNHEFLRSLGAEPITYGDGLAERVKAMEPDGVDIVADFAGGSLEATLAVLKEGGRHASIADGEVEKHGGTWMWVTPVGTELQELADLVDQENFQVEVAQTFPLAQAAEAFRLNMEGHTRGKVVVTVS